MEIFGIDILSVFSSAFAMIFASAILKRRYPVSVTACICTVTVCLCAALGYLRLNIHGDLMMAIQMLGTLVVIQSAIFLIEKHRSYRSLFIGLSLGNVVSVTDTVSHYVDHITGNTMLAIVQAIVADSLLFVTLYFYIKKTRPWSHNMNSRIWLAFCMFPVAIYILSLVFHMSRKSMKFDHRFIPFSIGIAILGILSYFLIIKYLGEIRMREDLQRQQVMHNTFELYLNSRTKELKVIEERMRKLKHDSRHMRSLLLECVEEGRYEEVKELLRADDNLGLIYTKKYCENTLVSTVINSVMRVYQDEISLSVKADLPEQLSVDNIALAMVIYNLLENACDAASKIAEKEKWVSLIIATTGGSLLVEVKNPYRGVIQLDDMTELPKSEKGEGHGLGLLSVRDFVDLCRGEMDIGLENQEFSVRFLLPL